MVSPGQNDIIWPKTDDIELQNIDKFCFNYSKVIFPYLTQWCIHEVNTATISLDIGLLAFQS